MMAMGKTHVGGCEEAVKTPWRAWDMAVVAPLTRTARGPAQSRARVGGAGRRSASKIGAMGMVGARPQALHGSAATSAAGAGASLSITWGNTDGENKSEQFFYAMDGISG